MKLAIFRHLVFGLHALRLCSSLAFYGVLEPSRRIQPPCIGSNGLYNRKSAALYSDRNSNNGSNGNDNDNDNDNNTYAQENASSGFQDTDAASKGFVSALTNFVNVFGGSSSSNNNKAGASESVAQSSAAMARSDNDNTANTDPSFSSPASPQELLQRIRDDYVVKNYLWTGDIDLPSFDEQCQFTDPTLSFTGTDQFVQNLQNLKPIVNRLIRSDGYCQSNLLDIQLNDKQDYIQTRWNMVGVLDGLPWKPKIDVIGRTKFWYQPKLQAKVGDSDNDEDASYRVVFYDEEWEMPAFRALLQLVTPAGTIRPTETDDTGRGSSSTG